MRTRDTKNKISHYALFVLNTIKINEISISREVIEFFFRIRRKRRLRSESQWTKRVQSSYEKKWIKILACQGLLSANQLHFKKVSHCNYTFCQFENQTDEVRLRRPASKFLVSVFVLCPALSVCPAFGLKFRLILC